MQGFPDLRDQLHELTLKEHEFKGLILSVHKYGRESIDFALDRELRAVLQYDLAEGNSNPQYLVEVHRTIEEIIELWKNDEAYKEDWKHFKTAANDQQDLLCFCEQCGMFYIIINS